MAHLPLHADLKGVIYSKETNKDTVCEYFTSLMRLARFEGAENGEGTKAERPFPSII